MNRTTLIIAVAGGLVVTAGAIALVSRGPDRGPVSMPVSSPVVAVPAPAPSARQPLGTGLVAVWNFEDGHGNQLRDSSAGHHDGIVLGEVAFGTPGLLQRAGTFDGRTGWVVIPDAPDLRPSHFSVSLWFNASRALTSAATLIVKPQAPAVWRPPFLSWMIRVNTPTVIEASIGSRSTYLAGEGVFQVPPIGPGQWHHVALTFDGREVTFSFDGQRLGTRPFAQPVSYGELPVLLGADFGTSPAGDFWPGQLDQVAIWDRALDEADVVELFGEGRGRVLP